MATKTRKAAREFVDCFGKPGKSVGGVILFLLPTLHLAHLLAVDLPERRLSPTGVCYF
jgi:hypothetical protein